MNQTTSARIRRVAPSRPPSVARVARVKQPAQQPLQPQPPQPQPAHAARARDPLWMKFGAVIFYAFCAFVVYWGWHVRDQNYVSAKFGVGYTLGIVGTTLMALLLLYPARKRVRAFHRLGPISWWFRVHMVFGVIGPILVLFHSNFRLGSFNSQTVLIATLIVSISGFFGRYFYARIHHGLYGTKASLEEVQRDFVEVRDKESVFAQILPTIMAEMKRIERPLLSPNGQLHAGMGTALATGITTRWAYLRVRFKLGHALDIAASTSPIVARERARLERNCLAYASRRLRQLRRFAQFVLFERLFSIWHVVHYPLFLVLVVAVIVHIIAVHMY
jgi:hypothetical protein